METMHAQLQCFCMSRLKWSEDSWHNFTFEVFASSSCMTSCDPWLHDGMCWQHNFISAKSSLYQISYNYIDSSLDHYIYIYALHHFAVVANCLCHRWHAANSVPVYMWSSNGVVNNWISFTPATLMYGVWKL